MITYELRDKQTDTGGTTKALVKLTRNDEPGLKQDGWKENPPIAEEEWCTVDELNRLFDACARRWPIGWDLEKLITCVNECEFD